MVGLSIYACPHELRTARADSKQRSLTHLSHAGPDWIVSKYHNWKERAIKICNKLAPATGWGADGGVRIAPQRDPRAFAVQTDRQIHREGGKSGKAVWKVGPGIRPGRTNKGNQPNHGWPTALQSGFKAWKASSAKGPAAAGPTGGWPDFSGAVKGPRTRGSTPANRGWPTPREITPEGRQEAKFVENALDAGGGLH